MTEVALIPAASHSAAPSSAAGSRSVPRPTERPDAPTRIVLADDHAVIRDGLRTLLSFQPDFVVVGAAVDGADAIRLVRQFRPDVLLLDFWMPGLSGLEVAREVRAAHPEVRMILLTASLDRAQTVTMLREGVRGIVRKESPSEELFKCIRKVCEGEVWIRRDAIADLVDALTTSPKPAAVPPTRDFGLTPREHQILRLVIEGETNKGIATQLSLGQDTVKHHLTSIFNKTGASNRLELALFALHHRLIRTT